MYRLKRASSLRATLHKEAVERQAAQLIQRVYRGHKGRNRLQLKRKMFAALTAARAAVSLQHLKPNDIEELADLLEDYVRDYTVVVPLSALQLVRGVCYLLNGSQAECVTVTNSEGAIERRFVYSQTMSWQNAKLVLRR